MKFKRDKVKVFGIVSVLGFIFSLILCMGTLSYTIYRMKSIQIITKPVEVKEIEVESREDKYTIEMLRKEIDILNIRNQQLEKSIETLTNKKKAEEKAIKESASSKKKSVKSSKTDKIQQRAITEYWYAYDRTKIKRKHYMAESHIKHLLTILDKAKYKVDPHIMLTIYELESNFQYNIKTKGGSGYGQLIYSTGKWRYERVLKLGTYKREYALDPYINITITADYFVWLIGKYKGDITKAMKEYSGNAIGSRYQELIDKRLIKNTGKGLDYYNKISKLKYNGGNKK